MKAIYNEIKSFIFPAFLFLSLLTAIIYAIIFGDWHSGIILGY